MSVELTGGVLGGFEQAKESAYDAAKAGASAAQAALESVEHNVSVYVERKDYLKLKDIAEASDIEGKVSLQVLIRLCCRI